MASKWVRPEVSSTPRSGPSTRSYHFPFFRSLIILSRGRAGVPAVRGDGRRHRHLRLQPPPQHHRQPRSQGQQDGEGSGSA
ncbi:unnamed protein product [Triticum turgidum subsp. durum]|uniref:Uncharacterized protein n=1 Tax=Triticum turgidum subsp. durum TaxID=4567 RepID=A0A9R1BXL4_TRITD|nr:unnamed protein product [Triticum turgidum subsp. durum]